MIDKLLLRLRRYDTVTAEEELSLRKAMVKTISFDRGKTIVRAKTELDSSLLLLEGFVHRHKDLSSGGRQTLQLSLPGDFLDLHGFLLKQLDHDIASFSVCTMGVFPHEELRRLFDDHPHLGRLLWLSTVVDAAIHREWILSLGSRSAFSRLAHLLCELQVRVTAVGLAEHGNYWLPLTQTDFAEILGITPVHINRMLKLLRERGLATFKGKIVEIQDWEGLVTAAEFDPFYLSPLHRPR